MKLRPSHWLTVVVILCAIAYALVALSNMRTKVAEANEAQALLQEQVEQIQEENAALQYAIDHRNDESTIEDIARDRLGLVLPDEKIFYDAGE